MHKEVHTNSVLGVQGPEGSKVLGSPQGVAGVRSRTHSAFASSSSGATLWAGGGHHDTNGTPFSTLPRVWWESQTLELGGLTCGVAQGVGLC